MTAAADRRKTGSGRPIVAALVVAGLLGGAALSLATGGRSDVGLSTLWALIAGQGDSIALAAMQNLRLPRAAVAALLGVNLAVAGLILQAVTRNPLASPGILGINQGAALGLVAALAFPGAAGLALDGMAIAGALGAGALTFAIAGGFGGTHRPDAHGPGRGRRGGLRLWRGALCLYAGR